MSVKAIFAHDSEWGIGKDGMLPWPKNEADLKWFRECTSGYPVIMGRKTWESLPKKPLPNRLNFVVTKNSIESFDPRPYATCSIEDIKSYIEPKYGDVWIIGGANLFESCLHIIDEIWLNEIVGDYNCDTFLPKGKIQELFYVEKIEIMNFGIVYQYLKES